MVQFLKKRHIPLPAAVLSAAVLFLLLFTGIQTLRFQRFTATLFREELEGDTLSMHYILAYPENYGIPGDCASLPVYSKEAQAQMYDQIQTYEHTAKTIPPFLLRQEERLLLTLLTEHWENQKKEAAFPYYAEPLSPSSGIQSSLPILLAEYTFRTKQDVDNYLSLLEQIPAYLEGIADYEKEKAKAGLFMPDTSADKLIEQCYQIMDADQLANDTHFLNTTFEERLQALTGQNLLTKEEEEAYIRQNHSLLLHSVMPAYEALGDQILVLKGAGTNAEGLAHFPKGKEYYALLFAQTTGCDRSVSEVKQLLIKQLEEDTGQLSRILSESPGLLKISVDQLFPHEESVNYLEDLQNRIKEDFPAMPRSDTLPSYTVKQVSKSLEDYCSPAFYLTPPIDDMSENSIYINQKDTPGGLELYTTLAHEGYPGHLYQTVYCQLYQQKKHSNPARNLLHYGGYAEGWALYVEMLSYEYGKALLQENGASEDALLLVDAMRLNRSVQLCLYALLDLEIHYDGAGYEAVHDALCKFGITDPAITKNIYEYITEEPANYPKYYVGYLEFNMLKEAAKETWKEDYSDMRFHKMILETGPCPFSVLWERVK